MFSLSKTMKLLELIKHHTHLNRLIPQIVTIVLPFICARILESLKTMEELVDSSGVPALIVADRRLRADQSHAGRGSVYSLLRSWVKDDPTRDASSFPEKLPQNRSLALPPPRKHTIHTRARLVAKVRSTPTEHILNSLDTVPASVLLESHLVRMRLVRKWWQQRCAHRRLRYRPRLAALRVPAFE